MLSMKEINKRWKELNITPEKWFAVWMLGPIRKRKRVDRYELQALRDIVKKGGYDVIEVFNKKFKQVKVEGKRKNISTLL